MPSQPSEFAHAVLQSSTDTSLSDAPLPKPFDRGNNTAGAPRHESWQCMTSIGGDSFGEYFLVAIDVVGHPWLLNLQHHKAFGVDHAVDCCPVGVQSNVVVLVVVGDVLTSFSTATQPCRRCWQHHDRFSTDQSWGLPAVGLLQSNTGQTTPLCLQHQSCLFRDQLLVSPSAGIVQSGRVVGVVVGGQPTPSWLQHHWRCDGVHKIRGLPEAPSAAAAAALQVSSVVVVAQPRPSCLQHHSFFDGAQAASQLFNAT